MEIYIDDFSPYGGTFNEYLNNLENIWKKCIEMSLFLWNEKCEMLMNEGVVLGNHISSNGIRVDPSIVAIIYDLRMPQR